MQQAVLVAGGAVVGHGSSVGSRRPAQAAQELEIAGIVGFIPTPVHFTLADMGLCRVVELIQSANMTLTIISSVMYVNVSYGRKRRMIH